MARQKRSAKRSSNARAPNSASRQPDAQGQRATRRPGAQTTTPAKRKRAAPSAKAAPARPATTPAEATSQASQPTSLAREALAARGRYQRAIWTTAGGIAAILVVGLLLHGLLTPVANAANTANLHATPAPPDPLVGHYAPDITITDLSGNHIKLSSLRGKIVILNFWY
ncbi:MAG TPA: hypothetical protein VKQ36_09160, partial [Ktedonobacterales bacterium]|nr:hypothetical protein [Ktedonobacterales bacterium]